MKSKPYILLAEDDEDDQLLFSSALPPEYTLKVVSSGLELMSYLQSAKNLPDILFLDINMPGKNGKEVLEFLKRKENFKYLPVVILSTSSAPRDIKNAYDFGASGYLEKPASFERLKIMLKSTLDFWMHCNKAYYTP